jgi:hypothetical protein
MEKWIQPGLLPIATPADQKASVSSKCQIRNKRLRQRMRSMELNSAVEQLPLMKHAQKSLVEMIDAAVVAVAIAAAVEAADETAINPCYFLTSKNYAREFLPGIFLFFMSLTKPYSIIIPSSRGTMIPR